MSSVGAPLPDAKTLQRLALAQNGYVYRCGEWNWKVTDVS
jgi:hypothetical protein